MKLAPDTPTGLGGMMAGGKSSVAMTERHDYDYYPTPHDCTRALLIAEARHMRMHSTAVWEPCAFGGQIVTEARAAGFDVLATDIRADPANSVTARDFLATRRMFAPVILTNFPWSIAADMIDHALEQLRAPYLCALFKTQYWQTCTDSGRGRLDLFRRHPPNMRWDCTWRVNFKPGLRRKCGRKTSSPMNVTWFVWDRNRAGQCNWGLLDRTGPVEVRN
ncbi:hypothetical protein AI27_12690 [Sphingomonas sp. BHC-A]|nr:hypothetical protein AI27_12690 [Sphingomonas sp. BHC-A]